MTHISPLKKLFRRQKALAGVKKLLDEREAVARKRWVVLVPDRPPEFVIPPPGYTKAEIDFMAFIHESWNQ